MLLGRLSVLVTFCDVRMCVCVCVCVCARMLSCVWLFITPWTVAHQVPLSTEFSRQEYWSELPFPTPGDLSTGYSIIVYELGLI